MSNCETIFHIGFRSKEIKIWNFLRPSKMEDGNKRLRELGFQDFFTINVSVAAWAPTTPPDTGASSNRGACCSAPIFSASTITYSMRLQRKKSTTMFLKVMQKRWVQSITLQMSPTKWQTINSTLNANMTRWVCCHFALSTLILQFSFWKKESPADLKWHQSRCTYLN